MPIPHTLETVLARGVRQENGCLIWTGTKTPRGYGQCRFQGEKIMVHRLIYRLVKGPLIPGLTIHHTCQQRDCMEPSHLEQVSQRENILQGTGASARNAVKTSCPKGHPYEGENLYVSPKGQRFCRECQRIKMRHRWPAIRERENARRMERHWAKKKSGWANV